jgi:small subunit ribosomal protein S6
MRHYEMMVILRDALTDEGVQELVDRIRTSVTDGGGKVNQVDNWGKRPFAYEIHHRNHGYYAVLDLDASAETIAEVERQLKLNDDVVRIKTLRPDVRVRKPGEVRIRKSA